ncbi:hypothetical protein LTR56_007076 [Elasticomyces elasticus]|nr:hypothetical protein LTR56_007076 [Elasticomyces elasticus]
MASHLQEDHLVNERTLLGLEATEEAQREHENQAGGNLLFEPTAADLAAVNHAARVQQERENTARESALRNNNADDRTTSDSTPGTTGAAAAASSLTTQPSDTTAGAHYDDSGTAYDCLVVECQHFADTAQAIYSHLANVHGVTVNATGVAGDSFFLHVLGTGTFRGRAFYGPNRKVAKAVLWHGGLVQQTGQSHLSVFFPTAPPTDPASSAWFELPDHIPEYESIRTNGVDSLVKQGVNSTSKYYDQGRWRVEKSQGLQSDLQSGSPRPVKTAKSRRSRPTTGDNTLAPPHEASPLGRVGSRSHARQSRTFDPSLKTIAQQPAFAQSKDQPSSNRGTATNSAANVPHVDAQRIQEARQEADAHHHAAVRALYEPTPTDYAYRRMRGEIEHHLDARQRATMRFQELWSNANAVSVADPSQSSNTTRQGLAEDERLSAARQNAHNPSINIAKDKIAQQSSIGEGSERIENMPTGHVPTSSTRAEPDEMGITVRLPGDVDGTNAEGVIREAGSQDGPNAAPLVVASAGHPSSESIGEGPDDSSDGDEVPASLTEGQSTQAHPDTSRYLAPSMMTTPSSSTGPASPKPVSKKRKRPTSGKTMVNNGRNRAGRAACYVGDVTIPGTVLVLQSAVLNCSRVRNGFPDTRHVLSVTHSTDFRVDGTIRTQKREGAVSVLNEWAGDTRVFDGRMWARLLTRGNDWITRRFNNRGAVTPAQDRLMVAVTDHGDMGVAARLAGGVYNPRTAQASTAVATNPGPQQSAGPTDSVAENESTASALPGNPRAIAMLRCPGMKCSIASTQTWRVTPTMKLVLNSTAARADGFQLSPSTLSAAIDAVSSDFGTRGWEDLPPDKTLSGLGEKRVVEHQTLA